VKEMINLKITHKLKSRHLIEEAGEKKERGDSLCRIEKREVPQ
jgi:hypothetical protein